MKIAWRILPVIVGAGLGYGYYAIVGCSSGTCPITGNPFISTLYGALIGAFAIPGKQKNAPVGDGPEDGKS
jgi:hypothetical protein